MKWKHLLTQHCCKESCRAKLPVSNYAPAPLDNVCTPTHRCEALGQPRLYRGRYLHRYATIRTAEPRTDVVPEANTASLCVNVKRMKDQL